MNHFYSLLFLIFTSATAFCQDTEATLYFNDSTSIDGYGSVRWETIPSAFPARDRILFRLSKDDKPDEWDGEHVYRIVIRGYNYEKTYDYVPVAYHEKTRYRLIELVTEGEVNLYVDDATYYFPASPGVTAIDKKNYMVKRKTEKSLTALGGSKKKIAEYFNNCIGIVNKLATNEFNIGTLKDIVEYYNDLCVGSDGYDDTEEDIVNDENNK